MAKAPPQLVDQLCEELFLSPQAREQDDNLLFVRERLLKSEVDLASLLDLYGRVLAAKRVRQEEGEARFGASGSERQRRGPCPGDPLRDALKLAGIVRSATDNCLQVRNRIYARVFDRQWVASQMPDAERRRQRAAFRRGLARASAVAAVILTVMAGLVGVAMSNAARARQRGVELANLLYDADMKVAAQAWEEGATDRVRELLAAHRPNDGEGEAPFEWRYQWKLLNAGARTFRGHGGAVYLGALAPDGHLVTLDEDFQLRHWDTATQRPIRTLDFASKCGLYRPALSHDGRTLAMRTPSGQIRLLDTATGRLQRTLDGHPRGAIPRARIARRRHDTPSLTFSPDDRRLVSLGNFDRTAKVWDLASGREIYRIEGMERWSVDEPLAKDLALSPDGRTLALAQYPFSS